jgi:hypothetical protein
VSRLASVLSEERHVAICVDKIKNCGYPSAAGDISVRRSRLTIFFTVVSLLFTSIVYACSGLSVIQMSSMSASMDKTAAMERGPCTQHKQDICKSVRDRMLSVQPSYYRAEAVEQPIILFLPLNLIDHIPNQIVFSNGSLTWQTAFHAVFKLPLPFSLRVLRI